MSVTTDAQDFYHKVISVTDWEACLLDKTNYLDKATPTQKRIAEEVFFEDNNLSSDSIFFSGDQPFIQLKQLLKLDKEKIRLLHSRIWNEGKSAILAIVTPTELRIYDCYKPPVEKSDDVDELQLGSSFSDVEIDLQKLAQYLHQSKIDSGKIWEEYGSTLNVNNRVDKKLVANLKATRALLYNKGKGLTLPVIHDLLGRALFIFYLEDRKILTKDAYPKKPRDVNSFSDLLNYKSETYELFDKLKEKFNGDLFPISSSERSKVAESHLLEVKRCFHDLDVTSLQSSLWRMFQFEYIPIGLISSIYEEFMSAEEDNGNGSVTIREKGAYYTKPMLVEFMLNEVLPWPSEEDCRFDHKILDPACGSGIFLVESYRRLIARWKYANKKKKIDENSLRVILSSSIYGIDKDPEAIKVAAFSLYLAFLNYLEPIEIKNGYLEKKSKKLEPLIRWSDKKELKEREEKKPGNNLFQFNTFSDCDITSQKFDIIIGNPPWKKDKPEPIVATYIKSNNLPSQIVCAYTDYMPRLLKQDGTIALVIAAKILFNTGKIYENFRRKVFKQFDVDTIINLSVVRDIMFDNASAPGCVIIYKFKKQLENNNSVVYCVPKNIKTINNKQSLIIDASEIKYLPLHEILKKNSKVLKVAMWGGMRDYAFINRLNEIDSIDKFTSKFEKGTGLHIKENDGKFGNAPLSNHLLIKPNNIVQYYTSSKTLKPLGGEHINYRTNNSQVFNAPVILINEGSKNSDFCASFVDYDCAFLKSAFGISFKHKNRNYHQALVACLNSSLATYYYFLTSSSWGIDKGGRVQNNDAISFPLILERMSEETINELAEKIDEITTMIVNGSSKNKKSTSISKDLFTDNEVNYNNPTRTIADVQKEIDFIIYLGIGLSDNEKWLITDVLSYSVGLRQRYQLSGAEKPIIDIDSYSKKMASTLNQTLKYGKSAASIEVLETNYAPLVHIIVIHFNSRIKETTFKTNVTSNKYKNLLKEINDYSIEQFSESIYYRKVIKYYKADKIYLIKPNETRFWTISEALNDADAILADLLTQ